MHRSYLLTSDCPRGTSSRHLNPVTPRHSIANLNKHHTIFSSLHTSCFVRLPTFNLRYLMQQLEPHNLSNALSTCIPAAFRSGQAHPKMLFSLLFCHVLLTNLALVLSQTAPVPNFNPSIAETGCTSVVLPFKFCGECPLLPFDSEGNFEQGGQQIYDINHPPCRKAIENYARLNPCDQVRQQQVNDWDGNRGRNQIRLGVFMYSVCETCCDCIPIGSSQDEYMERKQRRGFGNNALLDLDRGNCPAHAVYDICKVWPKIRTILRPGQSPDPSFPEICPYLFGWLRSPSSKSWLRNPDAQMNGRVRNFLRQLNISARCRQKFTWMQCLDLESAQGRV